jgi:mevalonate-3-kinase
MKPRSVAVAYPGLPVVFAEGFRSQRERFSEHSHASLAVTDIHCNAKTLTEVELSGKGVEFTIGGSVPRGERSDGAYALIREMLAHAADETGIKVSSVNHDILTGSSDSGAAALVTALDDVLELGLPMTRMAELGMMVSETCYRSLIGGLSRFTVGENGAFRATQMQKPEFFADMMIYAVPFPSIKRFSADDLHKRVVQHKHYPARHAETEKRLKALQTVVDKGDLAGFMGIMELEAATVHTMFSELGMAVIKPDMKEVVDLVTGMRERGIQAYWNAAGGSCVYVFTLRKWAREVTRELKDRNFRYRHYMVAGAAKPV